MKTIHIHIKVSDLNQSISFYQHLFGHPPTKLKQDYAKWQLEDPRINFAISQSQGETGIEHLGIETSNEDERQAMLGQLKRAQSAIEEEGKTICCYAQSEKSWVDDPQGIGWEIFRSYGDAEQYYQVEAEGSGH